MNFGEIKAAFEANSGIRTGDIEDTQLAVWLNDGQRDLAFSLGNVVEYVFPFNGEPLPFPDDYISLVDCAHDYELLPNGKIMFFSAGDKLVYYRQVPTMFTGAVDQNCELNLNLHYLLPIFATSRYFDMESEGDYEESGHANKWMTYYQQGKASAIKLLDTASANINRWVID